MKAALPRELVLAIVPNTRGIGFACFEGPLAPVDWGLKELRKGDKNGRGLSAVRTLIEHLQPDVLVLEQFSSARMRQGSRVVRLQRMIATYAGGQAIEVVRYSRSDIRETFAPAGAKSRYEIAEVIAGQVHALSFRLPPVRKLWAAEDRRMALFDAASLAITHFRERGLLASESL